jgi:hypothetical protein
MIRGISQLIKTRWYYIPLNLGLMGGAVGSVVGVRESHDLEDLALYMPTLIFLGFACGFCSPVTFPALLISRMNKK